MRELVFACAKTKAQHLLIDQKAKITVDGHHSIRSTRLTITSQFQKKVNKVYRSEFIDGYLLIQRVCQKSKNAFCQFKISALTHRNDLLDFGKVFKEFIPSFETSVSTRSRLPKYQGKFCHLYLMNHGFLCLTTGYAFN